MKKRIFLPIMLLAISAAAFLTACSKSAGYESDTNNNIPTSTIYMRSSAYSPSTVTLALGTRIVWVNEDNVAHTVTADDNSYNSGDINPGNNYARTYDSVGVYNYHCEHHPGMTGSVTIVTK